MGFCRGILKKCEFGGLLVKMSSESYWYERKPRIKDYKVNFADIESDLIYSRRMRWKELDFCSYRRLSDDLGVSLSVIESIATVYDWKGIMAKYFELKSKEHDQKILKKQIEIEEKHFKINEVKSKVLQSILNSVIKKVNEGDFVDINEITPLFKQLSELAKDERVNIHLPNVYHDIHQNIEANVNNDLSSLFDEERVKKVLDENKTIED